MDLSKLPNSKSLIAFSSFLNSLGGKDKAARTCSYLARLVLALGGEPNLLHSRLKALDGNRRYTLLYCLAPK